jgi:hypothetical protein
MALATPDWRQPQHGVDDMYEAPKLVKYGTFRELTQGKNVIGADISIGWTGGMDCDPVSSCRS